MNAVFQSTGTIMSSGVREHKQSPQHYSDRRAETKPHLKMNEPFREHPDEEALERFLLNMSSDEEVEALELHVLGCEDCVEHLETLETDIAATRIALKQLEAVERILKSPVKGWSRWGNRLAFPRWSFVASGTLAAAAVIFCLVPRDVTITTYRGTETAVVSQRWPLRIHLNGEGLPPGPVSVELLDNVGTIVWRGISLVRDEKVTVTLPRITKTGSHFLRLSSLPYAGSDGDLLREFAFDAK